MSLISIETQTMALRFQRTELEKLFSHYAKGQFAAGRDLAHEIFEDAVHDPEKLNTAYAQRVKNTMNARVENVLDLVSTLGEMAEHARLNVERQPLFMLAPEIRQIPVRLRAQRDHYATVVETLADMMAKHHGISAGEILARLEQAKNATVGADSKTEEYEARLSGVYMGCAMATCTLASEKMAYVGAVSIAAPDQLTKIWSQNSTNIINTLKNIDAFFQHAQWQLIYAKQRGAAWTLQAV